MGDLDKYGREVRTRCPLDAIYSYPQDVWARGEEGSTARAGY